MNSRILIIYEYQILYQILNEISESLNFEIIQSNQNDFKEFNSTEMLAHIRSKLNGGDGRRKIKGKTGYLWYLPWQRKSQDELRTPDMGEETPF